MYIRQEEEEGKEEEEEEGELEGGLHTQKRHRPVTACCTFRPDTGMIS